MAETLGLVSAQASARCTVCHSPFQSAEPSRLTGTARQDEGVSCESCHNAASSWFRGHTRTDWTYPMRVTAGMRDLRNFYIRANTCVACHQNVDNDLLAAGHPQLRFELDGQSVAEPKHWQDTAGSGAKAWLVGQAVALREISWGLSNMESPSGEAIAKWNALVWLLAKIGARDARLTGFDAPGPPFTHAVFINMQQRADSLARSASEARLDDDFGRLALLSLTNTENDFLNGSESSETLFCRAERLAAAMYRLAVSAKLDSDASPTPEGRALFESIQTYGAFDPVRFRKALLAYRDAIANSTSGKTQ